MSIKMGNEGLHDTAYLRAMHMAVPSKIIQSASLPHRTNDETYLKRRVRGQLDTINDTLGSMLKYDSNKRSLKFDTSTYISGGSDIAFQLGVHAYTVLPSPKNSPVSYGSTPNSPVIYRGSGSPLYTQKSGIEYMI